MDQRELLSLWDSTLPHHPPHSFKTAHHHCPTGKALHIHLQKCLTQYRPITLSTFLFLFCVSPRPTPNEPTNFSYYYPFLWGQLWIGWQCKCGMLLTLYANANLSWWNQCLVPKFKINNNTSSWVIYFPLHGQTECTCYFCRTCTLESILCICLPNLCPPLFLSPS